MSKSNGFQIVTARTEEVLDTANNNLRISMQTPDDWNSGKLSATFLNLDWKLNGIFATNFATKLFASSKESIAFFAIVNAPSLANAAIPLAQKFGLISFALSQFVTINKESDITLSDGSQGHSYSVSVSVEQLRKLKAPIDKALDAVLITTEQQDKTYIIVYTTEIGRMSQYQSVFDSMLNSVTIGAASLAGAGNGVTTPIVPDINPSQINPPVEPPSASQFSAKLNGGNEVPPVDSRASGTASFSINGGVLSYKIQVSKLDDVTGAHLHMAEPGANGDVIVDLLRGSDKSPTEQGIMITGSIDDAGLTGPLSQVS
jgi:CHRD domain